MSDKVIYFPHSRVPENEWFTRVLLYWDEVGTIAPSVYPASRLGSYTGDLIQHGLVRRVEADLYVPAIVGFTEGFIKLLDSIKRRPKRDEQPYVPSRRGIYWHVSAGAKLPTLAVDAVHAGFGAYFISAHDLVTDLGRAYREGRLDRRLRIYLAPKVLVIDEMGYLPLDDLGATIFFRLVSARYERGSIILTSNKSYGDWGTIFGDPIIATAILDRLLHHSTTLNIRGERYRLKERKKAGLLPAAQEPLKLTKAGRGARAEKTGR